MSYELRKLITHNFLRLVRIQRRAEVALAVARRDENNQLTGVLGPPRPLERHPGRRARADADHQTLLFRQPPRHLEGVIVRNCDHLADESGVEYVEYKSRPESLYLEQSCTA